MKKIFLVLIFSVFFGSFCLGQSRAEKRFEKAVQLIRSNQIELAQEELLSLRDRFPEFLSTYLALSEIYIAQNNIEQAKAELLEMLSMLIRLGNLESLIMMLMKVKHINLEVRSQ